MRCIGTLEFVTDFHNKCHQTQRQLLLAKEQSRKLADDDVNSDFESDKENTSPNNGPTKSRVTRKTLPSGGSIKSEKSAASGDIGEFENAESGSKSSGNLPEFRSKRKSTRVENKLDKAKKIKCDDELFVRRNISPESMKDSNDKEKPLEIMDFEEKVPLIQRRKTTSPWRRSLQENVRRENDHKEVNSVRLGKGRRKSGRKICTSLASSSTNAQGNLGKSEKEVPPVRENPEKVAVIKNKFSEEPKTETAEPCAVVSTVEKFISDSSKDENTVQTLNKQLPDVIEEDIHKAKHKPNAVKTEETSNSNDKLLRLACLEKTEELPLVASSMVISMPEALSREVRAESTAKSPRPGDEAGGTRARRYAAMEGQVAEGTLEIVCEEDEGKLASASLVRKTVIESVKKSATIRSSNKNKPDTRTSSPSDEVPRQRSKFTVPNALCTRSSNSRVSATKDSSESGNEDVENYRERRKKSVGLFGRLSELITEEQKEIIESLYTVNMEVVDDEEVYKNINVFDKTNVECHICGKSYPRMDKCQVHVWGHLNMKPYCCKSCDFVTLTVSNIRCHIRKRHLKIKPFQCNLCEKSYGTAVLLEEHINSHTGAKPYKCKLCDFATSNRQVLSYHKTTHKTVKDISCEVCGKKFFSNCRMRAHMIVHNKDRNLMCKLCSTYLCNSEALEKHYQKVHSRDYVCNICGLRTRSRKALANHENVHLAAKFRCPLCSNVYKSKHMLKEHLLKHQGIRKYKCELCHKSFAQQSHIAAHMSVHIGKRYPCPGCKKLFNRRDNMRTHTRRCKLFKSNPNAENSWANRTSTRSFRSADGEPKKILAAQSTDELKTDGEELETSLEPTNVNLASGDETDDSGSRKPLNVIKEQCFEKFKSGEGEIFRIGEVEIFPLSNPTAAVNLHDEGNAVVTENVLRPEYF